MLGEVEKEKEKEKVEYIVSLAWLYLIWGRMDRVRKGLDGAEERDRGCGLRVERTRC